MSTGACNPEYVAVGEAAMLVGRAADANLRLFHPTVSRRHAIVARTDEGIQVADQDSRFGTFVNGARVRTASIQPGDRIQFGTYIVYRVQKAGLRLDLASCGVSLTARRICVFGEGRALLADATFELAPDSFVGILGPSGSGKSTLLGCVASYRLPASGQLLFDGTDAAQDIERYRALLGYVPQEDVVDFTLTVRENLWFAAKLRLGQQASDSEIDEAIAHALDRVGLEGQVRANPGQWARDLSGGERKRLSVAMELLRRPRLLLLDEPTSGLDPANEANLMEQLRLIARRGTTVLCTTHLMENVRLLDQVVILGRSGDVGRVAYVGSPDEMLAHFTCRTFADLYDKLEAGQFDPDAPSGSTQDEVGAADQPTDAVRLLGERAVGKSDTSASASASEAQSHGAEGTVGRDEILHQVIVIAQRALLLIGRDRWLWGMMLAQPAVLGVLVSLAQFGTSELVPLEFFSVVVAVWLGLNNSIRDLVRQRKQYLRERVCGVSPDAYLGAKWAVYTLIGLLQLVALLLSIRATSAVVLDEIAAKHLTDLSLSWWFLVLLLSYSCGLGLGLLVSAIANTEEAAVAALPLLILPQLLLSVVAASQVSESYARPRAFKPLVATLAGPQGAHASEGSISAAGKLVDGLSLLCYSRPGTLLLESPRPAGYGSAIWVGDLCHLLVLLFGTWAGLYWVFLRAEKRWPRLIKF